MQASLKETSVVLEIDNSRSLDMDQIVSDVKAQYEDIASRSREETETWYRIRVRETFIYSFKDLLVLKSIKIILYFIFLNLTQKTFKSITVV